MIILRILLVVFTLAAFAYLAFQMLQVYRSSHPFKPWILGVGALLLLAPAAVLAGAVKPTLAYLFFYPLALAVLIYFVRSVR
jgi:hypothetical protein